MQFTTIDRDNDLSENYNCARDQGGWWYRSCAYGHLTGLYGQNVTGFYGMTWGKLEVKSATMTLVCGPG